MIKGLKICGISDPKTLNKVFIADFIQKNLIHESLLLFSEIISKGFDGRLFINGLASHFRNLMIAKDERTLKILEYTKDTIEKFKTQAELFDNEYLSGLKLDL